MSNVPTKDTDRWSIKTERITPVFCYLVLSAIASKVYDIGLLVAAIWCLLIFLYGGWAGGWARCYGSVGVGVDRTSLIPLKANTFREGIPVS